MLPKKELVWRELLVRCAERGERRITITELAATTGSALATVHAALRRPRQTGQLYVTPSGVRLLDPYRLLLLWAAHRDLRRDVLIETVVGAPAGEIERHLAASWVPSGFGAYLEHFRRGPSSSDRTIGYVADRAGADRVMARLDELDSAEVVSRGATTVSVLEGDPALLGWQRTPLVQVFVDLWATPGWQAPLYANALLDRLQLRDVA